MSDKIDGLMIPDAMHEAERGPRMDEQRAGRGLTISVTHGVDLEQGAYLLTSFDPAIPAEALSALSAARAIVDRADEEDSPIGQSGVDALVSMLNRMARVLAEHDEFIDKLRGVARPVVAAQFTQGDESYQGRRGGSDFPLDATHPGNRVIVRDVLIELEALGMPQGVAVVARPKATTIDAFMQDLS